MKQTRHNFENKNTLKTCRSVGFLSKQQKKIYSWNGLAFWIDPFWSDDVKALQQRYIDKLTQYKSVI